MRGSGMRERIAFMSVYVAILAGGRGERFWPLSRATRPKQVLRLAGDQSLLAQAVSRAKSGASADHVWIVSGAEQKDALEELSLPLSPDQFLWEPIARNTAPAIGAAAARVSASAAGDEDALLLVLPADHWIPDTAAFWRSVERGSKVALARDAIVTFGIPVARPETGYGYIERGEPLAEAVFAVDRFHEKPTLAVAREYLASGRFYWNAGIFLARPRILLEEMAHHIPQMAQPLETLKAMLERQEKQIESPHAPLKRDEVGESPQRRAEPVPSGFSEGWRDYFEQCPSITIDHGVLERSSRVAVVEAEFSWSDVGGWESWADLQQEDTEGNRASEGLITHDARDNIVFAEPGHLVALLGVSDLVVVQTDDVTLVCPRERAQEVRELVKRGRADERWKDRF